MDSKKATIVFGDNGGRRFMRYRRFMLNAPLQRNQRMNLKRRCDFDRRKRFEEIDGLERRKYLNRPIDFHLRVPEI